MAAKPRKVTPPRPVLVAAWECLCHRCGHAWTSICACGPPGRGGPVHLRGCSPPGWCPKCKSGAWQYPLDPDGPGRRAAKRPRRG